MNIVIFYYNNQELKIQSKPEDKMKKIFQNFGEKAGINYKNLFFIIMAP